MYINRDIYIHIYIYIYILMAAGSRRLAGLRCDFFHIFPIYIYIKGRMIPKAFRRLAD